MLHLTQRPNVLYSPFEKLRSLQRHSRLERPFTIRRLLKEDKPGIVKFLGLLTERTTRLRFMLPVSHLYGNRAGQEVARLYQANSLLETVLVVIGCKKGQE